MGKIYVFFISLFLLLPVVAPGAEISVPVVMYRSEIVLPEGEENEKEKDKNKDKPAKKAAEEDTVVRYKRMRGFRMGLDFSRVASSFIYGDRMELGISSDFEIKDRWYWTGEIGITQVDKFQSNWTYSGSGFYLKNGINYNFIQPNNPDYKDAAILGARIAGATFSQEMTKISLGDGYWNTSVIENIPKQNASALWLELLVGARAEMSKNIFIGGDVGIKLKFIDSSSDVTPYYIPGYGKGHLGMVPAFNYYILYLFPPKDPKVRMQEKANAKKQRETARENEKKLRQQEKDIREARREARVKAKAGETVE